MPYPYKYFLCLFLFLHVHFIVYPQCYEQQNGNGLYLFSPVRTRLSLYKSLPGLKWGDTLLSKTSFCPGNWRMAASSFILQRGASIYAAHSGILRVFTTGGNNFLYDACWIDDGDLSTAYFNIITSVTSNQFVYAGQKIGTVINRPDTSYFYFSIRKAKPVSPTMERAFLPIKGEKNCVCNVDPIWPEYFVNPTVWSIYYDYNDSDPKTRISVTIKPSWAGKWSFDNGKTWLLSGETVSGLPQKYYKLVFQERKDWKTPLPIEINATDANYEYNLSANYESEKKLFAEDLAKTHNSVVNYPFVDSTSIMAAFDSVKKAAYDLSYSQLRSTIYRTFTDSLRSKIADIERQQKIEETKNGLLFIVLPIAALLSLGIIIFYFQYMQLRKRKKHVEELQKELHHRVRNNLGIVSALVDESTHDPSNKITAKELESRINSIGFVHEQLYQQKDITKLDLQTFLENLCKNLISTFSNNSNIEYKIDAHLSIETKQTTQLALVLAELITNSLKHGFKLIANPKIFITASCLNDNKVKIVVSDNGTGFPDNFNSLAKNYGIKMVYGLVKQMKGEIKFYNENGAFNELIF